MALDFKTKDILHRITAKFIHAYLPEAKKPYNLKAVFQPELDVHGLASKAEVYNIETDPKVIEEGLTAAFELMLYLTADGFKIKTPLFNLRVRLPGEYDGDETRLPDGVHPEVRLQTTSGFREYVREKVQVLFDGIDDSDGLIAEAVDEKTGLVDEAATIGNFLTIHGYGLKIEGDADHPAVGLFFQPASGLPIKAELIAINEHRTLKVVVPALSAGVNYYLRLFTQSSGKGHDKMLKEVRDMKSDFTLKAQA